MHYYKIILAYDGTDFVGWQVQPNGCAVANVLHDVFVEVFKVHVSIIGASRTDTGVHALGQVVLVKTVLHLDPETLRNAWNNRLPSSLVIRSIEIVDETFHPQRNVDYKIYWYHFFIERPLPFAARYGYWVRYPTDFEKLRECLKIFVGTHDFRSFCTGDEQESTIKTIDAINLEYLPEYNAYRISVRGHSFLRYMIRRIVGATCEVASRPHLSLAYLHQLLQAKNPEHTLPNAPAQGLILAKIIYK